jgi:hypothetical protein
MGSAFLAMILPMMGVVLASAALVGDPTLELQFATRRPSWRSLLERLGLLFGVIVVAAVLYQLYLMIIGVDLSLMGNLFARQIAWIVTTIAMMALSTLLTLLAVNGTIGVAVIGGLWVFQLILHDWFETSLWGRYLYWFAGSRMVDSPDLPVIQLGLVGMAVVFMAFSVLLIRREERYI